jgi:hypothetical protein
MANISILSDTNYLTSEVTLTPFSNPGQTLCSLSAGSFTPGNRYLVMAQAQVDNASAQCLFRVYIGASELNDSRGNYKPNLDGLHQYQFGFIWTATGADALTFYGRHGAIAGGFCEVSNCYLTAIDLDTLGTKLTDWFLNENPFAKFNMDNTFANNVGASVTFTPDGASDYLVIGGCSLDNSGTDFSSDNLQAWFRLRDTTAGTTLQQTGWATGFVGRVERTHTLCSVLQSPAASSRNVRVEMTGDNDWDHDYSFLLVIRLNWFTGYAFGQSVIDSDGYGTSPTSIASASFAADPAGEAVFISSTTADPGSQNSYGFNSQIEFPTGTTEIYDTENPSPARTYVTRQSKTPTGTDVSRCSIFSAGHLTGLTGTETIESFVRANQTTVVMKETTVVMFGSEGGLGPPVDMDGSIAGTGSVAGGLQNQNALAGTVAGVGTVSAALQNVLNVSGTVGATGTVSAALTNAIDLEGAVAGVSTLTLALPAVPAVKLRQAGLDVWMDGGTSEQQAVLDINIVESLGGRVVPALDFCPGSRSDAIRFYRDQLGAAVVAAQDAVKSLGSTLDTTDDRLGEAKRAVDRLLAANPDPTTPRSTDELTDAIGGLRPTTDRESLERRAAETLGLNIVNGVLFPKGTTRLATLRALAQSVGITADNCDLSALGPAGGDGTGDGDGTGGGAGDGDDDGTGTGDGFLLATTRNQTVERVVGSTCGDDIVEFEVVEIPIGTNISIEAAAELAGIPVEEVNVRLFWLDTVRTDPATLQRLKALGLTAEELGAAVTGGSAGRLSGGTVETSVVPALQATGLTDDEVCALLARPDLGGGIDPSPTADSILATIRTTINQNSGGNRNKAGTDADAIASGAAGRGGDPVLLLFGLVNIPRSLRIGSGPDTLSIDGTQITREGLSDDCTDIFNILNVSLDALESLLAQAQDFVRELLGRLSLGNHQLSAGVEFANCLVSFNLGLDLSLELSLGIPFLMEAFLAAFAALLAGTTALTTGVKSAVCLPQGIIQLLFGGICGFKPFDFNICPPDLQDLVQRLVNMLNTIILLITKLAGALLTMKADITAALRASIDLKGFSVCSIPAMAVGIALGLLDTDQLAPTASGTVSVT